MSQTPQTTPMTTIDRPAPPSFEAARNRRQRVRAAGLHPDYWYPVAHSKELKPGKVLEARFWKRSFAIYRTHEGELRAVENRCAHRQLKLSLGQVDKSDNLVCPYHGWCYNQAGRVVHMPHELFGKPMPNLRVGTFPVRERYGLIWLFPGDAKVAETRGLPEIPELSGPSPWACTPVAYTWKAHHSMLIDNVCDFTHEYLHRRSKPFRNARLTRLEAEGDKIFVEYDTEVGNGAISGLFVNREKANTNHMKLCYEYPFQWSNTGDRIKHHLFVLPIDERTTRAFFLFYFDALRIPFTRIELPQRLISLMLRLANPLLVDPIMREDGFAVEAEQEGYDAHFDAPIAELNPVVPQFQALTIRKWQEHLAKAGTAQRPCAGAAESGNADLADAG